MDKCEEVGVLSDNLSSDLSHNLSHDLSHNLSHNLSNDIGKDKCEESGLLSNNLSNQDEGDKPDLCIMKIEDSNLSWNLVIDVTFPLR